MKVDELIRTLTLGKNSSDWGIKTFYHITAKQILCHILQVNMRQDSVSPSCPKLIQSCVEAVSKVSQNFLYVVHVVPQWCQVVCIEVAMLTLDVLQWLGQLCLDIVIEDWWEIKKWLDIRGMFYSRLVMMLWSLIDQKAVHVWFMWRVWSLCGHWMVTKRYHVVTNSPQSKAQMPQNSLKLVATKKQYLNPQLVS